MQEADADIRLVLASFSSIMDVFAADGVHADTIRRLELLPFLQKIVNNADACAALLSSAAVATENLVEETELTLHNLRTFISYRLANA